MASPRAIEKARAAMVADGSDTEQSGSVTRVYDEAGYWSPPSIFPMCCRLARTPLSKALAIRLLLDFALRFPLAARCLPLRWQA
jgi:hypothetical protein